jgi:GNAT superfamily N-acetyltransferase
VHFLVHASTTSADVCYLQDLFTAPETRGKGVARALIAEVERWARERGCTRVYWHTQSGNENARRRYDQVAEASAKQVITVSASNHTCIVPDKWRSAPYMSCLR